MANSKACAACKYQRRKCTQTCELAAYFPASRFVEFVNAQHMFGMSNIEKILATVEPDQIPAAAETILFEGNIWRNNPSVGCLGVTRFLLEQVDFYEKELEMTNLYLAFYRELKQQLDSLRIQSAQEAPVVPDQFPRITAEMKKYEEGTSTCRVWKTHKRKPSSSGSCNQQVSVDLESPVLELPRSRRPKENNRWIKNEFYSGWSQSMLQGALPPIWQTQ